MPDPPPSAASFEPVRHFIGWSQPLLTGVVDHLVDGWSGGLLDLSDLMVVVPTRQSGRRLREALAERASRAGVGVFPPRVLTPEAFLTEVKGDGSPVATPVESLVVWARVLMEADLADFPNVFPEPPPRKDAAWALRVAGAWQSARQTLGEGGLCLAAAAERLGSDGHAEAARWADLAAFERRYEERLTAGGWVDAQSARRQAAQAPVRPSGVTRLEFLAVTDPLEIAVQAAARLGEAGLPVAVVVAAPRERAGSFDAWGRPIVDMWRSARDIPIPLESVHLAAGPREQACRVHELASGHADPASTLGLGVADSEVAEALGGGGTGGSDSRLVCYRPEGLMAGDHEFWHVLAGWAELLREPSFRALGRWLRFPPVALLLRRRAGLPDSLSQARMLERWDAFAADHLPQSLDDARAFDSPEVNLLAAAAAEMRLQFGRQPLTTAVADLLSALYAGRSFAQDTTEGRAVQAFARELSSVLAQAEGAATRAGLAMEAGEALAMVLDHLRRVALDAEERPPDAVDVNGWLELAWEDAAHLIVAGVNDGLVPEVIPVDPYLPESVRNRLGLGRTNAFRFARDAHQWHLLLSSRCGPQARVDVVVGRYSAAGDPLRPSRLLFLRPDDELAPRALALFSGDRVPPTPPAPAWRASWRLRLPPAVPMAKLSVTAFRDYLACPFRFHLRHGLGMREVDPDPRELDAAGFGRLCHAALKAMTAEPGLRRCTDEAELAKFLKERVVETLCATHGSRLPVPLRLQLASAEKRLTALASWQAQSVRDGWETIQAELPLSELLGGPWMLGGLEIRGVVDRVDARGEDRRIVDYKTSDAPRPVDEAHLGKRLGRARPRQDWPEWQRQIDPEGKLRVWRDLQLPLYALAARQAWGRLPEVGYFHLAKAVADCRYEPWTDLDEALLASAERCALGVVEAVNRQEFWPPREAGMFDPFGWLLGDAAEVLVDPASLLNP